MQRGHGSCRVRSILDPSVLEVRSLVHSLECGCECGSILTVVVCVFPGALGEGVGELRGGMKAASTSPQVHSPPQPRAAWITSGASQG